MGYKLLPLTVRALADLPVGAGFDPTPIVADVQQARSGLLLVTYNQGTNKGSGTYPRVRVAFGAVSTSLFQVPLDDASAPTNLGYGVGLQTDLRNAVKALRDDFTTPQCYPVTFGAARFVAFAFAEFNQGVVAGQLSAQLVIELDH